MRTNIEIDDELMQRALALSGLGTKRAVVHAALEQFVNARDISRIIRELQALGGPYVDEETRADMEAHRVE